MRGASHVRGVKNNGVINEPLDCPTRHNILIRPFPELNGS